MNGRRFSGTEKCGRQRSSRAHVSMLGEVAGPSDSDTNLDEANVSGALAEASSADEHVVLADQACGEYK